MLALCRCDRISCREPLHRQLHFRVGEAFARRTRAWALVGLLVRAPRDVDDLVDLCAGALERGIVEALAQSLAKHVC